MTIITQTSLDSLLQHVNPKTNNVSIGTSTISTSVSSRTQNTSKPAVSLSEESKYKSFISQVQSNTVSSIDDNNKKSINELVNIYMANIGNDNADYLQDTSTSGNEARSALASQAADFMKSAMDGDNPLKSLSRNTLSSIAYDTSGSFTSSERLSAYFQMNLDDSAYGNQVYDKLQTITESDYTGSNIIRMKSSLEIISGMSEAEKESKGITDDSISLETNQLAKMEASSDMKYADVEYTNLTNGTANNLLVAHKNNDSTYSWQTKSSQIMFKDISEGKITPSISSLAYLAN